MSETAEQLLGRILEMRKKSYSGKKKYTTPAEPSIEDLPEIPASWRWTTAEALSDQNRAITYGVIKLGKDFDGGIPTLRSSDVRPLRIELDRVKTIDPEIADDYKRTFLEGGEIVITVRGTLGGIAVVPPSCKGYNISREVAMIAPVEPEVGPFTALMIASTPLQNWMQRRTKGVTYRGVNIETLKRLPIPLPPLPEQRRIVARIEEFFSRLDAGVAALRRAKAQLQRYRQSVLAAAVTGQLTGSREFPASTWQPIATAIDSLGQGWSPKCKRTPSESSEVWAVIKTTAIQAGEFLEHENKELPRTLKPRPNIELQAGDLLITRAGPRTRVGVACHVKQTRPRLMLCDKAYRIRTVPEIATPAFLALVLNAPQVTDELEKLKTGINDSGLNLTQKRFQELKVPLPRLAEQLQIVAEVESRTTAIDHLEAELDRQITRSNRLRQSVLNSAFAGALSYS